MFTLCIPTMNRFDKYLSKNLQKYLDNQYINEIIITDENGNDIKKIKDKFNNYKLKLFINEKRLGPFLNKLKALHLANNKWIALIDSDNFADIDYFRIAKQFIDTKKPNENTILSPCYASDTFRWEHLSEINQPFNKLTSKQFYKIEKDKKTTGKISHLMNLGNYILNKKLANELNIDKDINIIKNSYSFDVVLMNTLFFEQFNINFWIINDMKYQHITSEDSIYLEMQNKCRDNAKKTYDRLYKYLN